MYGAVQTGHTNSSSTSKYLACRTKALVPKRTDLVGYGTTFTTKRDLEDDFGFISCTSTSTNIFLKLTRPLSSAKLVVSFACFFYFETGNSGRPANFLVISSRTNGWRTINSLVHKIRLHGRRGKGMAESFSRQKSRHAPQKEGGLKILCDLPPV